VRIVESGKGELRDVERGLFAYSHEMVGAALLDYWNYPKSIVKATYYHHDFEKLRGENKDVFTLCAVISIASGFCRRFGIGLQQPEESYELVMNKGCLALEANPVVLEDLMEKFHPEFIHERNLFLS
jgi:HD-like signal output (HDOD) protein